MIGSRHKVTNFEISFLPLCVRFDKGAEISRSCREKCPSGEDCQRKNRPAKAPFSVPSGRVFQRLFLWKNMPISAVFLSRFFVTFLFYFYQKPLVFYGQM